MSLFLGNLSSHIHQDDLERVFQRFGRCNIRIKDGYGFVVYDFPPNAEKALRTLQGKDICGEPIILTWSNKQPRSFQRFTGGARSYEVQHGRYSAREGDHANRKLKSNDRRGYGIDIAYPDSDGRRPNSADMLDADVRYHHRNIKDYAGESHHSIMEGLQDEGGSVEPDLLDDDRWGEQVGDPSHYNGIENGSEFDRYEPSHGYDKREEADKHQVTCYSGSPTLLDPQDKTGNDQTVGVTLNSLDNAKTQLLCYYCGESGHKMRSCPQEHTSQRRKSRFDMRGDNISYRGIGKDRFKRLGFKSMSRLRSSRDDILMRQGRKDVRPSDSGMHQRYKRTAHLLMPKSTRSDQRRNYGGEKRSRRENGSPISRHLKKGRGSVSSPPLSDYSTSRSRSHSLKSGPRFSSHSRSRFISSRSRTLSSSSRSSSASLFSRSGSYKSRIKSSSRTSLSLSVSLGRPFPSSPNKVQMNLKGSPDNAVGPNFGDILVEDGQQVTVDAGSDSYKHESRMVVANNENTVSPVKPATDDIDNDHHTERDDDDYRTKSNAINEVNNRYKLPLEGNDNDNWNTSNVYFESQNPCKLTLDNNISNTGSLHPDSLTETRELQNSVALVTDHWSATTTKPNSEAPITSHLCNSTSISSEEMFKILKHYGLKHPEEPERHLAVEAYFGSARLWPWEIVYYRRLKKGPISTENYARRIAQNEEFGIVDKYIRSSSGWGELGQDNS